MSISELIVIFLIAMLVIKPEQLPDLAFNFGRLTKMVRGMFSKFKTDMNDLLGSIEKTNEKQRD